MPISSQTTAPPTASAPVAGRRSKICDLTVEVEDEPVQVFQVLDVPRLVEAERVADGGQQLGGRLAPGAQRGGIGRRQRVEDHVGQEADHEEQHDHPEKPADDEGDHGLELSGAWDPRRRSAGPDARRSADASLVVHGSYATSYLSDV
jgi:hypothetical protein